MASACCPHDSCVLSVLRGIRNGAVYGAKIRFPHALVMTLLFKRGHPVDMVRSVFRATYQHSKNLATFVGLYKAIVCLLRALRQKESGANAYIAGALGALFVWADNNPINSQINMYILSRILWGLVRTGVYNLEVLPEVDSGFSIYAAVIWGFVMYLFHYQPGMLQPSLESSMQYLYKDSDVYPSTAAEWLRGE